ncbi:hypothetical protein ACGFIU_18640 [Rhodococcus oryzae]|uniref:hypothetical protein n=1 Tax=Rhodococcus oryzae TaxID=2571143 RepID=UPI0037148D66
MIVTLKPNADEIDCGRLKSRPNFIDGVSDVLGIMMDGKGRVEFRVIERTGRPSLWPVTLFDIVDNSVPDGWEMASGPDNSFSITYRAFARVGYWEEFFDGAAEAEREYISIVRELGRGKYPLSWGSR